MKPGDGLLVELARRAGVKPPHIFHLAMYRKQLGEAFSADGYAVFAMMEVRHVVAMVAVLDTLPAAKPRQERQRATRTVMLDTFVVPDEWLLAARERRFWTLDVCQTEAAKFVLHHSGKGTMMANWRSAWLTWINAPWKENGSPTEAVAGKFEDEDARLEYLAKLG